MGTTTPLHSNQVNLLTCAFYLCKQKCSLEGSEIPLDTTKSDGKLFTKKALWQNLFLGQVLLNNVGDLPWKRMALSRLFPTLKNVGSITSVNG